MVGRKVMKNLAQSKIVYKNVAHALHGIKF